MDTLLNAELGNDNVECRVEDVDYARLANDGAVASSEIRE